MTVKIFMIAWSIFLLSATAADARTIKVLILDDVFQKIPAKEEPLEKMGKLKGDLLVNGTHYIGDVEVLKGNNGLYLINELPLEEYVKNVVSAEVGTSWDMEALKVQAVISRTYAIYQKKQEQQPQLRPDLLGASSGIQGVLCQCEDILCCHGYGRRSAHV